MTLAVGRLADADSGRPLGTVFAVTRRLALTAFHCISGRADVSTTRALCIWPTGKSDASVLDGDELNDVALLRLTQTLPRALDTVPLSADVAVHERFVAPGAPGELIELPVVAMSGEITWPDGRLPDGARAIQLVCTESAAGLSLHGLSGAPVLTGEPSKAVGLIRWNPPSADNPYLAAGSIVYASPAALIIQRWPELPQSEDLGALISRLTDRSSARDPAMLSADIRALLVSGGLGIDKQDLSVMSTGDAHQLIVIDTGQVIIRTVRDLRVTATVALAEQELADAVVTRSYRTRQRYAAVLTDGAQWRLYQRLEHEMQQVDSTTASPRAPGDLLGWLEAILATGRDIAPSRYEIERKLGATSPSYKLDATELATIYVRNRDQPTVQVKRRMWAKLLTTASGISFADDDYLFIDHTLLVAMAKLIGHAVLGIPMDDPRISAAALMSGERFAEAGIGGVIEADFFEWVTEVPGGDRFILNLARRLARFDWSHVEHDVLKHLYESIIPQATRHQLGEYYTPDWLAEKIIADTVTDPLNQRALDASCGSGTFLFHAVRSYLAAAEATGIANTNAISGLVRHVVGIDVHPVAVTLARVTYLLAIGSRRLENRPPFSVPVYLSDSMRWGQELELTLDTYEGLSIPTRLDPESFVTEPVPLGRPGFAAQLNFPDRVIADVERFDQLVANLANLTTLRRHKTTDAALAAIFQRFRIRDYDQADLTHTFERMCELHDQGKDHIWGYYVRNVARPAWLTKPDNRVDVLVGNPPWLVQRYMTKLQQKSFRTMSVNRELWAGGTLATNQDLAALFITRCIELYLRPGGHFGYVMPRAVLDSPDQDMESTYAGFRAGSYPAPAEPVKVAFAQGWDLYRIKPAFFPLPPGVVFGRRQQRNQGAVPLPRTREEWSGRFDTRYASWADAAPHISRITAEAAPALTGGPSAYAARFAQGANFVPYFLFNIDIRETSPLGMGADQVAVTSRRSKNEKAPWKDLRSQNGMVEREFVRPLYTGESIMPFRRLSPKSNAIVPWDGQCLVPEDPRRLEMYQGLARWWRAAETLWNRYRKNEDFSLLHQLNFRRKLSNQLLVTGHRVVYGGSGMYMAAAIVSGPGAVVEHQLYWGLMDSLDEARFLTAILNSTVATMAIRHLQKRGEHNPRHVGKKVFKLPIPLYDPEDAAHAQLVALADHAEQIADSTELPVTRFELQRKYVRQTLERDGVAADIDAVVKTLLDVTI
jgi:N-6 DNA Methylase